jgi:glycosyltransferase involved in cell wall biosynthesis
LVLKNSGLNLLHYGPRFSRTPYVVTIHDLSYIHFPELFNKDDLYQLKNWSKYSIQKSTHIIAVSKSTKEDVAKHYEIKPEKITVVYEGYDKSRFKPQPQSKVKNVKNKYKIKGKYIIFIGTLQPRKNIEKLIEALSILKNQDLKLVIVGKKGWLYDKILEKSKELNIQSKVIFTGFVPDEKIPDLLGGAEVYVLPSLWEGFGIPVLEAQACNVPVVVSNTSSLPEVVGESGILIDPQNTKAIASGIERALDPKTRNTLIKKGSENIKRFSWEKCAKESLIVLEKVASK